MFKLSRSRRQPWICSQCLLRRSRPQSHRSLASFATAQKLPQQTVPVSAGPAGGTQHDDTTLRRVFDSPSFWKDFSSKSNKSKHVGLLQNKYLTSPAGFQAFTRDALRRCQRIVARVLSASSVEQYRRLVQDLDQLSDQLCRVIDLVEFIRNVHPNPRIQAAATEAHSQMYEYMNVLNTTPDLNNQLQRASNMPEVTKQWSEEEQVTARILLKDFAQSAITGSEEHRARFVKVSSDVVELGNDLMENSAAEQSILHLPSSKMNGMDPVVLARITRRGTAMLPMYGSYARLALQTVQDPDIRREIYIASRTASQASIQTVESLSLARAELAHLSDHESFAHMALGDKMARTPEAVSQFLQALAGENSGRLQSDLTEMAKLKQKDSPPSSDPNQINIWDREFYANRIRLADIASAPTRPPDVLASYFSLGTVMQGLSRLFSRLYGIRLVPAETAPGETWNDDVRRLDAIDERHGRVAVIYCDLFERSGKSPNPAHFTLRCARQISMEEVNEAVQGQQLSAEHVSGTAANDEQLSEALNDGMAISRSTSAPSNRTSGPSSIAQLPTIAFICDFPRPASSSPAAEPTLLPPHHLITLFHEMGHCLHSILGRTSLQNVAGTRCATDFAELPSVLMESFAADPRVLSLYARHWSSDGPVDPELVSRTLTARQRAHAPAETESQILLAALDQALHGPSVPAAPATPGWSRALAHRAFNDPALASLPEPPATAWHGFFGHLFQYGAVYYAYLFDRALAHQIWTQVFAADPIDANAGRRYAAEVLSWGGARDPWACVAGVLGHKWEWLKDESQGGERMRAVGEWGAGGLGGGS